MRQVLPAILGGILLVGALQGCSMSPAQREAIRQAWEERDAERARELFAELERFGVRHEDPDRSNVTYRQTDGRFCVIDFELATLLPGTGPKS